MAEPTTTRAPSGATGVLVLASGEIIWGRGFGAEGRAVGEVCFNTAMTGYQEVMTDPSYAGQIINFTFPHIGNVGTNPEDVEASNPHALGAIVRQDVTDPSNFRSTQHFDAWMKANGRIGISGIDTRALTRLIRVNGAPNAVIAHSADGKFDVAALLAEAKGWPGLEGMDLAKDVTTLQSYGWDEGLWKLGQGYTSSPRRRGPQEALTNSEGITSSDPRLRGDDGVRRKGRRARLWDKAQYPPQSGRCRLRRHRAARKCQFRRHHGASARRPFPVQRPRRSGGDGGICGAGDPAVARDQKAVVRHLPWPSNAGAGGGGKDRKDAPRPSRREPSGKAA